MYMWRDQLLLDMTVVCFVGGSLLVFLSNYKIGNTFSFALIQLDEITSRG